MKKLQLLIVGVFLFLVGVGHVMAQSSVGVVPDPDSTQFDVSSEPPAKEMVKIGSVNVYDAQITSRNGQELKIEFDILNKEGVQPEVGYGVTLLGQKGDFVFIADTFVADEKFTLYGGVMLHKSFTYSIKNVPKGEYTVYFEAKNADSLPLGSANLGTVEVTSEAPDVLIDPSSCYLTIPTDRELKKYDTQQGIDVLSSEKLILNCKAKSQRGESNAVVPKVSTNFRTNFGKLIQENDLASVTISDTEKEYSFELAKPDKPQAYDFTLVLRDANGNAISNKVVGHYVVNGNAVSIANVYMDKEQYQKGETATVSFSWGGIIGNFPGARNEAVELDKADVGISIVDSEKQKCSQEVVKPIVHKRDMALSLEVPISKDCFNPIVSVVVKDKNGMVLADESYQIDSMPSNDPKIGVPDNGLKWRSIGIVAGLLILVVFIIVFSFLFIYRRVKRGKSSKMKSGIKSILFLLALSAAFLSSDSARADQFADITPNWNYVTYDISLDKTTYSSADTMKVSAKVLVLTCSNRWDIVGLNGRVNGRSKTVLWGMLPGSAVFGPFIQTFRVQRDAGNYTATFWSILSSVNMSYSVTAPAAAAINGACGPIGTSGKTLSSTDINNAIASVDTSRTVTYSDNPDYTDAVSEAKAAIAINTRGIWWTAWGWSTAGYGDMYAGNVFGYDDRGLVDPGTTTFKGNNKAKLVWQGTHTGRGSDLWVNCGDWCGYWTWFSLYGESKGVTYWNYTYSGAAPNCVGTNCDKIASYGDPKPSQFCDAGISPITGQVTQSGSNWSWTCKGVNGGVDKACSTSTAMVNTCGLTHNNCVNGGTLVTSGDSAPAQHADTYTWTCTKTVDGVVENSPCVENRNQGSACGLASGQMLATAPTDSVANNLCKLPYAVSTGPTLSGSAFIWSCSDGSSCSATKYVPAASCTLGASTVAHGTTVTASKKTGCTCSSIPRTCTNGILSGDASYNLQSCTDDPALNNTCGSADGGSYSTAPTTNLCTFGAPSVTRTGSTWNWTCSGICGGTSKSCTASYVSADSKWKEVSPW